MQPNTRNIHNGGAKYLLRLNIVEFKDLVGRMLLLTKTHHKSHDSDLDEAERDHARKLSTVGC
jgi:hypothetical protein